MDYNIKFWQGLDESSNEKIIIKEIERIKHTGKIEEIQKLITELKSFNNDLDNYAKRLLETELEELKKE